MDKANINNALEVRNVMTTETIMRRENVFEPWKTISTNTLDQYFEVTKTQWDKPPEQTKNASNTGRG